MYYPIVTESSAFDAVVLGNGDYPVGDVPLAILGNCSMLCCCDNAGPEAMKRGLKPDAIVGDGDSLPPGFLARHRDIIHIVGEQEDNDQTKATRYCLGRGYTRIAYIGATGKREDHTLGNISLLATYRDSLGVSPVMVTDYGYFIAARGRNAFGTRVGRQVSIFNISCSTLQGSGLKWPVRPFSSLWQGTLNEATDDTVRLDGDGTYIVYFTFEGKQREGSL